MEYGTSALSVGRAFRVNLRGLPQAASWGALFSGLLVVLVSTTGPLAILFQAASAGRLSADQRASWLLMIFLGSGLFSLILSLRHGMPIIGAWGTATTALLVTGLPTNSFSQVVGAYFIASLALLLVGTTKSFNAIMKHVPRPVVMAMLAGILFRFGVGIFTNLSTNVLLGISMIVTFFLGRRFRWRAPVVGSLAVGLLVAAFQSTLVNPHISFSPAHPVWTSPSFSIGAIFTLALPIFLMVLTTQDAAGIAVLHNSHYQPPENQIVTWGAILSIAGAGFGGSGVNISTITAAIATQESADPNPKTRYFAGVACGTFYLVLAFFGSTVSGLFASLPVELMATIAGLALIPVIASSAHDGLVDAGYREAGLVTLLITVSGVSAWHLGSPFWGLVGGVLVHQVTSSKLRKFKRE